MPPKLPQVKDSPLSTIPCSSSLVSKDSSLMKPRTVLPVFLSVGAFAKNGTTWIYPTDPNDAGAEDFSGLSINYGDAINVQYISTFPSTESDPRTMALWCGTSNIQR